jgi:hypothetical protein
MSSEVLTLTLEPSIDDWDPREEAFLDEVRVLQRGLTEAGGQVQRGEVTGKGGDLVPVVQLVLGGGAGLTAILSVVRLWITRRGRRSVKLRVGQGEAAQTWDLSASNVSEETLARIALQISDRRRGR